MSPALAVIPIAASSIAWKIVSSSLTIETPAASIARLSRRIASVSVALYLLIVYLVWRTFLVARAAARVTLPASKPVARSRDRSPGNQTPGTREREPDR
jgi:hypothetical protein